MDDNKACLEWGSQDDNTEKYSASDCETVLPCSSELDLNDPTPGINSLRDAQVKLENTDSLNCANLVDSVVNGHKCRRKSKSRKSCTLCRQRKEEIRKNGEDRNERKGEIRKNGEDRNESGESSKGPIVHHGTDNSSSEKKCRRKRRIASLNPTCPICGITVRLGEVETHYNWEVKRLNQLHDDKSLTRRAQNGRITKKVQTQSKRCSKSCNTEGKSDDIDDEEEYLAVRAGKRKEALDEVRANKRKRYAKCLVSLIPSKRFAGINPSATESRTTHSKIISCPVCETPLEGSEDELMVHVEQCLNKDENETSAVESDSESYEEYTWAGQTRIRATTLLDTLSAFEGEAIKVKTTNEDEELDIDGDDDTVFGEPHPIQFASHGAPNFVVLEKRYSERDVIPCSADEPQEDEARERIRAAITGDCSDRRETTMLKKWNSEDGEFSQLADVTGHKTKEDVNNFNKNIDGLIDSDGIQPEKLESRTMRESIKCLICMEAFNTPLVSVVCWHVYCEECWLRTLGAKKLCPQCNTITSPTDLRRIYI